MTLVNHYSIIKHLSPPTCDVELEGHDEEVEDLAEEEEEGVAVVLVLQVVPERPQQALQLVVLPLDDPVSRTLGQEFHQPCKF